MYFFYFLAAPKEIYQKPVNRFVASFVGSPAMNFISGKIDLTNGSASLACADGITIGLDGYEFQVRPEAGRPVVLGVRPEQIHLHKEFPDAIPIPLQLSLVEPMGADSLLWGSVGDETLSIRTGPDEEHAIDERVDAYFQPSRASIFDDKTGARL